MADLPSIPQGAFAPLDYSGAYGNVSQSMVQAGKSIGDAANAYATFEKAKNKEQMRVQALNELVQERGHLKGKVRPDMSIDELGRGLSHLAAGDVIYSQMQKAKIPTLPDKAQFDEAVFKSSDEAFTKMYDAWKKQTEESVKTGGEQAGFQEMRGEAEKVLAANPEASREEVFQAATKAKAAGTATPQQIDLLKGMATSQLDRDKLQQQKRNADLRFSAAKNRLAADQSFRELMATAGIMDKNFDNNVVMAKMRAKAEELRAIAERRKQEDDMAGLDGQKAFEQLMQSAEDIDTALGYLAVNRDAFQEFASSALQKAEKKNLGGGKGPAQPKPSELHPDPSAAGFQEITLPNGTKVKVRKKQ
jgi:hypothetical protein